MSYRFTLFLVVALTFCVVTLGAYVRLSDAGLGCPDWPGCYGHLGVPDEAHEIHAANQAFPERPVEAGKAWKEMVHRYIASGLGLLIVFLMIQSWRGKGGLESQRLLFTFLALLVAFQGALGMWTVTEKVKPIIVTAHLAGGLAVLSIAWMAYLRHTNFNAGFNGVDLRTIRPLAVLGLLVLIVQILLGGWVSTNYAALACTDFPTCGGEWWPSQMDFDEGFVLWRGLGVDYEFGVLEPAARTAVHFTHRLGAIIAFAVLAFVAFRAMRFQRVGKSLGVTILILLIVQVSLGISNIEFSLPLAVAVMHNGGAALLLLSVVALNVAAFRRSQL